MRKPIKQPYNSQPTGTRNRFGRSRLGGGFSARNSNARIVSAPGAQANATAMQRHSEENLGLNSERMREHLIQRLEHEGNFDKRVLQAMAKVPRHEFVDQGLASRAYEEAALPIGFGQTISSPWVVARMISAVLDKQQTAKILEVGGGCGYQAAVLAHIVPQVFAIERIRGLYEQARERLARLSLPNPIRFIHGDGMAGYPDAAPFDAIIVAAAGLRIPDALLQQLAIGGRLIAPEGDKLQHLVLIERLGSGQWHRTELEGVRFVPLKAGVLG